MRKFRILQDGNNQYKVQEKITVLFIFHHWETLRGYHNSLYSEFFETLDSAKEFINHLIERDRHYIRSKKYKIIEEIEK